MNVAIDVTALLPTPTGVDNYVTSLVLHLAQVDRENQYTLFTNYEDRHRFGELPDNFRVSLRCVRGRPARLLFQQLALPVAAGIGAIDVLHSPSFFMPYYRGRPRHLVTIHDMTFVSMPECHTRFRRSLLFRSGLLQSVRRADLMVVPSRSTLDAIVAHVPDVSPDRIRVVPFGIGAAFRPYPDDQVRSRLRQLGVPQPYILYVGTIEPRKNLSRLVESYRQLVRDRDVAEHLVLAGRWGWGCDELRRQLALPELLGKVHLAGYVAPEDLPLLYAGAALFVYPSLYEGFGFPPLEAMASGTPTVASRSSALAENLADAAELVPPTDTHQWTSAIGRLLSDDGHRMEKRTAGLRLAARFRWENTATQTIRCYRELADGLRTPS